MLFLTAILIGIIIGQHIQITASPELTAFLTRAWAWGQSVALPAARSGIHQLVTSLPIPSPTTSGPMQPSKQGAS